MNRVWLGIGVDGGSKWRAGMGQTEITLDELCEGGLWQRKDYGGDCVTIRERYDRVESLDAYVDE